MSDERYQGMKSSLHRNANMMFERYCSESAGRHVEMHRMLTLWEEVAMDG